LYEFSLLNLPERVNGLINPLAGASQASKIYNSMLQLEYGFGRAYV
jgi:hypothetical protein